MKKIITIGLVVLIGASAFLMRPDVLRSPQPIELKVPDGWPAPNDIFKNNPLTREGFQLGRKLFYDGRLSKDGNFACASCHQQFAAFATFDHDFSHGFGNQFTTRNAPALQNLAWAPLYHWDGGINHIELQALAPMTAPNEMAANLDSVLDRLKKDTTYQKMFFKAFGSSGINSERMLKALAQFTGSLVSAHSKYDRVMRGEATFIDQEAHGYRLFQKHCSGCHKEPLFTDFSFRNNGLELNPFLKDYGRMAITALPEDSLKFKVPSLRNVGVTQPYMHDGRLYSLQRVIDHYRGGIVQSATLDSSLKNEIPLTRLEKYDLVLFLETLTDSAFLKNPRFGPPGNMTERSVLHNH